MHNYTGITHAQLAALERVHIDLRPVAELGVRQRHQLRQVGGFLGDFPDGATITKGLVEAMIGPNWAAVK